MSEPEGLQEPSLGGLILVPTDELITEIHARFDGCLIVTWKRSPNNTSDLLGYFPSGGDVVCVGLAEAYKAHVGRKEWQIADDAEDR